MEKPNKYSPPRKRDAKDYMVAAARAGLALIPDVGGVASALLGFLVTPSLEKRKSKWMTEVGQALLDIENRLDSLENLQSKEGFIDVAIEATRIALSTNQEELHSALKNAVLNSAISESVDGAKQKMFLHFLDTSTEWHIMFIKLFDEPEHYMRINKIALGNILMGGITDLIEAAFPQLRGQDEFSGAIWNDIFSKKLFNTPSIHGTMSRDGIVSRRTTELGRDFLKFIEFS